MTNLLEEGIDRATEAFRHFRKAFHTLDVRFYRTDASLLPFLEEPLREADVVILHEWNDPKLAEAIVSLKAKLGFRAHFHDTHHRPYPNPTALSRLPPA